MEKVLKKKVGFRLPYCDAVWYLVDRRGYVCVFLEFRGRNPRESEIHTEKICSQIGDPILPIRGYGNTRSLYLFSPRSCHVVQTKRCTLSAAVVKKNFKSR